MNAVLTILLLLLVTQTLILPTCSPIDSSGELDKVDDAHGKASKARLRLRVSVPAFADPIRRASHVGRAQTTRRPTLELVGSQIITPPFPGVIQFLNLSYQVQLLKKARSLSTSSWDDLFQISELGTKVRSEPVSRAATIVDVSAMIVLSAIVIVTTTAFCL